MESNDRDPSPAEGAASARHETAEAIVAAGLPRAHADIDRGAGPHERETVIPRPEFEEETRRYLQDRLRLGLGIASSALLVIAGAIVWLSLRNDGTGIVASLVSVARSQAGAQLFSTLVVALAAYVLLRTRQLPSWALSGVDGLFLQASFALVWFPVVFERSVDSAVYPLRIAILIHMVFLRAVLIPSTFARTLLLSAPAPLVLLAIDIDQGRPEGMQDLAVFLRYSIIGQVLLISSVAVAALASEVNATLRRRTWEAANVGAYALEGRIGKGAMAEVYRARHVRLKRPTAIKFIRSELVSEATRRFFEREVTLTARLTHPNTILIYDYGETPAGDFYYAMELLDGRTLREVILKSGPMDAGLVVHVLKQACGALSEAHAAGLIHRDISPNNIMLCRQGGRDGVVKLLDFGLVKDVLAMDVRKTPDGAVLGTPETCSPEVTRGQAPGPSSDLYSLSAVGYFLLTGGPVFECESLEALIAAHQGVTPRPPSERVANVPADLEHVILRGLRKLPEERFEHADAMLAALEACGGRES